MTRPPWLKTSLSVPSSTLDWLLEPDDPSVRYFTLRELLGETESSSPVRQARRDLMSRGRVPVILARQKPAGNWGRAEDFYQRSKYKGTVWTLILLATLGADGADPRLKRACEFILSRSQEPKSGGFAHLGAARGGGRRSAVIPCLTGNMLWCLIRFGFLDDARVERGIAWMSSTLRCDDRDTRPPRVWPYSGYEMCWGRHTCLDGVVKPLKALAEVPPARRSAEVRQAMDRAVDFLLRHRLYERSHALGRPAKPKWLKLGHPLMWDTDALEMLDLMTRLGCRDERLRDAVELILSKRDERARWSLEETYEGRYIVPMGKKGSPSKWVTLRALAALKRAGAISGSGC